MCGNILFKRTNVLREEDFVMEGDLARADNQALPNLHYLWWWKLLTVGDAEMTKVVNF